MNTGILAALILVLIVAGTFVALPYIKTPTGGTSPITQQWVDQQLVAWKPAQNQSIGFSAFYRTVSYGNPANNSFARMQADLAMLQSSDASCIREDLNFPLPANIPTVTGQCLIIADAGQQSYYSNPLPWDQFKLAWIARVAAVAAALHPAFYIVVKEPGWYVRMISDATTNPQVRNATQWTELTQALVAAVQAVSPNTKVGIAITGDTGSNAAYYIAYLQGVKQIPGISFIGFDLYNEAAFTDTLNYLNNFGAGNKNIWIAEAWSSPGNNAYDPSRAQLDKSWMLLTYYFALKIHATNLVPFFTDIFSGYTQPVDYSQRTPVFYEFQGLAMQYGGPVS